MGNQQAHQQAPQHTNKYQHADKSLPASSTVLRHNSSSESTTTSRVVSVTPISVDTPIENDDLLTPTSFICISPKTPEITKITQRVISDEIVQLAAYFWHKNIETLPIQIRIKAGSSMLVGMLQNDETTKQILTKYCPTADKVERAALRYLDMIGWLLRAASAGNNESSINVIKKLGELHDNMGIGIGSYAVMLKHLHITLESNFPKQYTDDVRFAIDEVFTYGTQLMTGEDLKLLNPINPYQSIDFLSSLRACLSSEKGREYLFRYLSQVYCDEMVMFLDLLAKYKNSKDAGERIHIAQSIKRTCLDSKSDFAVNISYEDRKKMMAQIDAYEALHNFSKENKMSFLMADDFFVDVEDQVCRLIKQSHWKKFAAHIAVLDAKQ